MSTYGRGHSLIQIQQTTCLEQHLDMVSCRAPYLAGFVLTRDALVGATDPVPAFVRYSLSLGLF